MLPPRDVDEVIAHLPLVRSTTLPVPAFNPEENDNSSRLVLGVESMRHHMTDEGWQLTYGLSEQGYLHCGHRLPEPSTDVLHLVNTYTPGTVVVQDKREWDFDRHNFRDPQSRFRGINRLASMSNIFRVTVLKDAQQRPYWHSAAATEMGCNAWIVYYHPRIVKHVAPYVRTEHLIRTYHTLDPDVVPVYTSSERSGCLFSGAVSSAYPLRQRIVQKQGLLPITSLNHPGYHRKGTDTPNYLLMLSKFKVAICTSSMYGYSLRKIIEATAAGCRVITDLPTDDYLPNIDDNLIRIHPDIEIKDLRSVIESAIETYNPKVQCEFSNRCVATYNYYTQSSTLHEKITKLRKMYNGQN